MKIFMTLNEYREYIPDCIICGKDMLMKLSGTNARANICLHSSLKDNFYYFQNKTDTIIINPDTNEIISGIDIVNNMISSFIYMNKYCKTCDFGITSLYTDINRTKKCEKFPSLKLYSERMNYTMRNNKMVNISNYFYDDSSLLGSKTNIFIDGKLIKEINLDLSRFKNLEQLNRRLSTILTFQ